MRDFDSRHWTEGGTLVTRTSRLEAIQQAIDEYGDPNLKLRGDELHWLGEQSEIPAEDKQMQRRILFLMERIEDMIPEEEKHLALPMPDLNKVWGKDLSKFWRIVDRIQPLTV